MKRIRIIGLCLIAVFALSAVAASAASAAEEKCGEKNQKKPCFTVSPNTFTGTSAEATLETVSGLKVTCTSDSSEGKITGEKTDTANVTFKGCKSELLKAECQSGTTKGEIKTVELASTLGYISKAAKTVGIALEPKAGKLLATFECGGVKIEVEGSVIGALTLVNTKTTKFTLTFTQTKGVQSPQNLEGKLKDVLFTSVEKGTFVESGEGTVEKLTMTKATRVEA